ncbi:MAG: metal-dependent transcriptional regulator [Anaerotignaceae bacterium]
MNIRPEGVTASLEDYLEAIYILYRKNAQARITDVARELDISKPSVNRAINTLKAQGLVEHEHYGDLKLTEKGEQLAKDVVKRHDVLKSFLMDCLGVKEETAEKEACLIEHNLSADTINKLIDFMEKR